MNKQNVYAKAIRENYPSLVIRSAHLNDHGQYNDILTVNDELIFRFPRYPVAVATILNEIHILSRIQGYVTLPIPNPIYTSKEVETVGEVFMGYRRLPGEPLWRETLSGLDEATLQRFAGQLAGFLQELHSIPLAEAGINLPVNDEPEEWRELFGEFQRHLFPFMRSDARRQVADHFEAYLSAPHLHHYPPSLRHGDFGAGNILFNREKGAICGVIDFGFAGVGDPATDIAAASTMGDAFFSRFRDAYYGIESMLERACFYRGTYALYEALHGIKNGDKAAFESGIAAYV